MGGGDNLYITPPHHIPPLAWGCLPPLYPVSPLPPCQNVVNGGIIPSVKRKKFSGKNDPLSEIYVYI